jgi:hypothetical protein
MFLRLQLPQKMADDLTYSASKTSTALYESRWQWCDASNGTVFATGSLKYTYLKGRE